MATKPLFELGRLRVTPGANRELVAPCPDLTDALLKQHAAGDWGDIPEEDWLRNDRSVGTGGRLMSVWPLPHGGNIWIITEGDRSETTILLPEEHRRLQTRQIEGMIRRARGDEY